MIGRGWVWVCVWSLGKSLYFVPNDEEGHLPTQNPGESQCQEVGEY